MKDHSKGGGEKKKKRNPDKQEGGGGDSVYARNKQTSNLKIKIFWKPSLAQKTPRTQHRGSERGVTWDVG